jgi:hypothetical protein
MAIFGFGRATTAEGPTERMSGLLGARDRGRQRAEETGAAASTLSALRKTRDRVRAERDEQASSQPAEGASDGPSYVRQKRQEPREEGVTTTSELLKSRRQRRDDEKDS